MSAIIGREKEISELKELYDSDKSEFVAVYGRRRVGKTFLVDEALKGKITFRHAGLSPAWPGRLRLGLVLFHPHIHAPHQPQPRREESEQEIVDD